MPATATVPPPVTVPRAASVAPTPAVASWPAPDASQRIDLPSPIDAIPVVDALVDNDPIEEHTTLSARRSRTLSWTLTLPNGSVELVTDAVIIGRAPEFSPAIPTARLVPVPDPTRSVSKNHAVFRVHAGVLEVEDLGSTNGVIVTRPDGREVDLGRRGAVALESGARVELGDIVLRVGRR